MDFAKLKNNRGASAEKLMKAMESTSNKFARDERYWEPTVDKAGNGFATIRFLDAPFVDGEDATAFVQFWSHSFKGPSGQWYIENSLTSLGQEDPVAKMNSELWETGVKANQELVSNHRKRKLNYVSNILVVSDPSNPSAEGKVFLYKYGKKIFDKIKDKLPQAQKEGSIVDPDDKKFDPFNFWDGANFKLKINKDGQFRSYDKSDFQVQSPLFGGDDKEIEKLWKSLYSLKAEIAPDKFKSYAALEKRLFTVLGIKDGTKTESAARPAAAAQPAASAPSAREEQAAAVEKLTESATDVAVSDDDDFAEFARLANEGN
jgi:hypothetical protein